MFSSSKSIDENQMMKFLDLIVEKKIRSEIFDVLNVYFEDDTLFVGTNVMYGTLISDNNEKNDYFRFFVDRDKITCMYTKYNCCERVYIEQEDLDSDRVRIKINKSEYGIGNPDRESNVIEKEIIYDKLNNMISYESTNSIVTTYILYRDSNRNTLVNYSENINCENQIEIHKCWYFKNDKYNKSDSVKYILKKNLIGDHTDVEEYYTISNICLRRQVTEDLPSFKMLCTDHVRLDKGLFEQFLQGEIDTFDELKEKNNLLNRDVKQRVK